MSDKNPFRLSPTMLAFADYLRQGDTMVGDGSVDALRTRTKALRLATGRAVADLASVTEGDFQGLRTRTYAPSGENLPVILYLHGGGWSHLDIDVYDPILRQIAVDGPAVVIGLDYPLAPEAVFPAGLDACVEFARHLRDRRGITSIGLMGDSAGANLALSAALQLRQLTPNFINSLGLIYGSFELVDTFHSYDIFGGGSLPLTTEGCLRGREVYVPSAELRADPMVSPLRADFSDLPPVFISIASHDPLYDENVEIARRMGYAGVDVSLRIYPGTIHGFFEAWSVNRDPDSRRAILDISTFMARDRRLS